MPPAVFMGSLDDRWTWDGADFVAIALWQKYKTNTCTKQVRIVFNRYFFVYLIKIEFDINI